MSDSAVRKYRKKPEQVEAMQLTAESAYEVAEWCGSKVMGAFGPDLQPVVPNLTVQTINGDVRANWRDWIVRDAGGFRVVRQDAFEQTYEEEAR